MKRITNKIIDTYEDGDFIIEITRTDYGWDAWLCEKSYGIKNMMFGCFESHFTYQEFLEAVEANLPEYEADYTEEYIEAGVQLIRKKG